MTLPIEITNWLNSSIGAASRSMPFMMWNTFLALIPLVLSQWLFRGKGSGVRRVSWWIGLVMFVAFLPNAPYVLTDIIHLVKFIKGGAAIWTITFVLVPQFLIFMLIGTEAYVVSLINVGHYLRKQGWGQWTLAAEISLHALCSIGIFLGRFPRFNSWDLITGPQRLLLYIGQELIKPQPIAVMLVTFLGIAVIYWPLKQITLAMILYWQSPEYRQSLRRRSFE